MTEKPKKEMTAARRAGKIAELAYARNAALESASKRVIDLGMLDLPELLDLVDDLKMHLAKATRADKKLAEFQP